MLFFHPARWSRIVVKELVGRGAASPDYVYECLGIEQKEKEKSHIKKKDVEESAKFSEQIVSKQSTRKEVLVSAGSPQIQVSPSSEPDEIERWDNPDKTDKLEQENKEQKQDQDEEPRQEKINRYKKIIQNFIESNFLYGFEKRNIPAGKGEPILLYHKENNEYIPISIILSFMNRLLE